MDQDVQKELKHVENILGEIRENTSAPWWKAVLHGSLYGAGWVIGTVGTFAALGWLLSIFGVIPGIDKISAFLQEIMRSKF
jgi:hypothetical protein